MTRIKVCGIRTVHDAERCVELGVDTLGLNFWPGTPRCVSVEEAWAIRRAVGEAAVTVGLFVDVTVDEIRRVREEVGLDWVQLHGHEPPEILDALLPRAYKAIRVPRGEGVTAAEVAQGCARYGGDRILVDASVAGMVGGTGQTFDWELVAEVAARRKLILAGGITSENAEAAIETVHPWQLDSASGVESAPGVKDIAKVRAFVEAVRRADERAA